MRLVAGEAAKQCLSLPLIPPHYPCSKLLLSSLTRASNPSSLNLSRSRSRPPLAIVANAQTEIRVCVNRSCVRLGSRETLQLLSDLAPPQVSVNSCGCLARCGAGPNVVVLPDAVFVSHCGTPSQAAQLMARVLGDGLNFSKSLEALDLRKKGEVELEKQNYFKAECLLSQAIDLKPLGGLHIIHKSRSVSRLALGNYLGALEDAKEASRISPSFPQAYLYQGDAFLAMGEFGAAEESYSYALSLDPSIRRSKSFKARVLKLQEKLSVANTLS